MLALMPQTPATTADFHTTPPLTMSLAVLPHAPVSLQTPSSSSLTSSAPLPYPQLSSIGPSKRPKLTLNTAQLPTSVGKSTTALRIETLSVASPTARNTFQNAFGPAQPSLNTRVNAPTPLRTSSTDSITSSISSTSATSENSYASSASSTDSVSPPVPYRLPYNAKSILTNGPLPRVRRRRSFTTTRPMFPSAKKVSFRAPLTEEIRTEKYTMAHIDLESSSSSISSLNLPPPQMVLRGVSKSSQSRNDSGASSHRGHEDEEDEEAESRRSSVRSEPRSPHTGDKRESSDEEDSDTCPTTPVTRHSKRRREWVWTLGPIKSSSQNEHDHQTSVEDSKADENKEVKR